MANSKKKSYISYFKKQLPLKKFKELFPFGDEWQDSEWYSDFIEDMMIRRLDYDDRVFTKIEYVDEFIEYFENPFFDEGMFEESMEYVRSLNIMDYETWCDNNQ